MKKRTLVFIVVISVLASSIGTALAVGDRDLLHRMTSHPIAFIAGNSVVEEDSSFNSYVSKLKNAYSLIKNNYVRPVYDHQLIDGAIQGMINSLGDPYSTYMDPKTAKQFKEGLQSSFTGIGAEVTMQNGRLTIVSPFKGSPAEKGGLRSEDQVVKVNGQSLEGMDLSESVSKIRGPKGTKALLEIVRPGVRDILHVMVIRSEIPLETVLGRMNADDHIGVIRVDQFSVGTAKDFKKELNILEAKGMKGLVIDVRGNPGGLLPTVLEMLDQLVPNKKTVLITKDKAGNQKKYTSNLEKAKPYPIVVLIDRGSASASEILAAALKEAGGYLLVGETSFGKGTVQSAEVFPDGSNMKLTMAKWLTPKGNWIDQHGGSKGIKPDIKVSLPGYFVAVPPQVTKPLKLDNNSIEVKNLQLILEALGFTTKRKDGYFDKKTELAVKAFQRSKNLTMTGECNKETAVQLLEEFFKLKKDPQNDVQLQVAVQLLKKKMK